LQRERIIKGIDGDKEDENDDSGTFVSFTSEEIEKLSLIAKNKENQPKRKHRKTHGKIGFADLARSIADKWKKLGKHDKQLFEHHADKDKERYKIAMEEYSKKVEQYEAANPDKVADRKMCNKTASARPSVLGSSGTGRAHTQPRRVSCENGPVSSEIEDPVALNVMLMRGMNPKSQPSDVAVCQVWLQRLRQLRQSVMQDQNPNNAMMMPMMMNPRQMMAQQQMFMGMMHSPDYMDLNLMDSPIDDIFSMADEAYDMVQTSLPTRRATMTHAAAPGSPRSKTEQGPRKQQQQHQPRRNSTNNMNSQMQMQIMQQEYLKRLKIHRMRMMRMRMLQEQRQLAAMMSARMHPGMSMFPTMDPRYLSSMEADMMGQGEEMPFMMNDPMAMPTMPEEYFQQQHMGKAKLPGEDEQEICNGDFDLQSAIEKAHEEVTYKHSNVAGDDSSNKFNDMRLTGTGSEGSKLLNFNRVNSDEEYQQLFGDQLYEDSTFGPV
jgi:hypothetical protein